MFFHEPTNVLAPHYDYLCPLRGGDVDELQYMTCPSLSIEDRGLPADKALPLGAGNLSLINFTPSNPSDVREHIRGAYFREERTCNGDS